MSWGITIPDVYVMRASKLGLEDDIEDLQRYIQREKEKLIALMCATPRVVEDESGYKINWEDHILQEMDNTWDDFINDVGRLQLLKIALDNKDELTEG